MEPRGRRGLRVVRTPGSVLLRDEDRDTTYVLNPAAFAVFALCDGATPAAEMVRRLSAAGLPGADAQVVQLALQDLAELGLVAVDPPADRVSRRSLLQRLGSATQAAAQLPVVEAVAGWSPVAGAATVTVTVGPGSSFSPSSLTLNVGDTVAFSFASSPHTVTHGSGCSKSPNALFDLGGSGSVTFTQSGTYPYFCTVSNHCQQGQTGVITVKAASPPPPPPPPSSPSPPSGPGR